MLYCSRTGRLNVRQISSPTLRCQYTSKLATVRSARRLAVKKQRMMGSRWICFTLFVFSTIKPPPFPSDELHVSFSLYCPIAHPGKIIRSNNDLRYILCLPGQHFGTRRAMVRPVRQQNTTFVAEQISTKNCFRMRAHVDPHPVQHR